MPRIAARFVVLVAAVGVLTACDRATNPAGPGAISSTLSASFSAQLVPQALPLIPMQGFSCPSTFPFQTTFDLLVGAASTNLFLQRIVVQPFDTLGLGGSALTLTSGDMSNITGSGLIPAGSTRSFTLTPRFGCGLSLPERLAIDIFLADAFGTIHQRALTAQFRR